MTIARWGISTILFMAVILTAFVVAAWHFSDGNPFIFYPVFGISSMLFKFTLYFFRNPNRVALGGEFDFISPADGTVSDIEEISDEERYPELKYIGEPCVRIGVFMSVFSVHVNRSPIAGEIEYINYQPGKFLDARHPDVSHENEVNAIGIKLDENIASTKILLRQLSGFIARRIICAREIGDKLDQNEIFGMIKFGSRVELWIPVGAKHELKVKLGDKVKSGESILASLVKGEEKNVE